MADGMLSAFPPRMKTTQRGLLTELRVQVRLVELGANVLIPIGSDQPFDMVIHHHGQFSRVQVKTARDGTRGQGRRNGTIKIPAYSVVDRKGGKVTQVLTRHDCDVIIAYYGKLDKFYAVRPGQSQFLLRFSEPQSTGGAQVRFADDYELRRLDQLFPIGAFTEQDRATGTVSPDPALDFRKMPLFQ